MNRSLVLTLGLALSPGLAPAGEIGFLEDFALAPDRAVPLRQLIPGTEDYYYFHALHAQNTEQFDKAEELVAAWIKRHGYTARVYEILNRQALLTYERNPQKSLDYLKERLGLRFDHQRQLLDAKPDLPTRLDEQLISREALVRRAFNQHQNLEGLEDAALDWLVGRELDPDRQRHLLERLQRPDHDGLVKLIAADLDHRYSRGFGSFAIHRRLLLAQLDELLKLKPDLLNQQNLVQVYLSKLRPGDDEDWRHDKRLSAAYLDRLWAFVSQLAPVHNSLKAHVLYHRLVLDRSLGVYDKDRFLAYIRLPRNVPYIAPRYMQLEANRRHPADLNADFSGVTLLPPVGDDEPLVRSYLAHFFVTETTYKPYETYISDEYLKPKFAETKIVRGLGEPEQWYSLLDPAEYQALKERVDLDFAWTNPAHFAPGEPVALDVDVKNVRTLIVKVFELNTRNYYTERRAEIDTDIDLDGLVPNAETTHEYAEPPLRRVRRRFEFPQLKGRGVYVIDFIGNGQSSRALVRQGRLHFVSRTGTAGHVFTVLDEQNRRVPGASLLLGGHEYRAGDDGTVRVPFSTQPGRHPVVLVKDGFASLDHFQHEAENYELSAGIYVDRESLLERRTATVVIRAGLKLNGTPVTLKVLEQPQLVITSTDLDGVVTTKDVRLSASSEVNPRGQAAGVSAPAAASGDEPVQAPEPAGGPADRGHVIADDRELAVEFQVPQRLARIEFVLKAQVEALSRGEKVDLTARQAFVLNQIDTTEKVEDLHFANVGGTYVIDLLGKTGEPKADRPVQLSLKHRDFTQPVDVSLQSDRRGRIVLGRLDGIAAVTATGPEGTSHTWPLLEDRHTQYQVRHGLANRPIAVPWMGHGWLGQSAAVPQAQNLGLPKASAPATRPEASDAATGPARSELSLLELRDGTFVRDRFDAVSIVGGLLKIDGLPAGDYDLLLKRTGERIRLRLTDGPRASGYLLGATRKLEVRGAAPLQIAAVEAGDEHLTVRLQNASPLARVHVFATRFQPAYQAFAHFGQVRDAEPYVLRRERAETKYVAGRNIGDEYRYVIERRYAPKFPGNMLDRPQLLLNPWAIRKTGTETQQAAGGDLFGRQGAPSEAMPERPDSGTPPQPEPNDFSTLDFLAQASAVLVNLRPDEEGVLTIPRERLGSHQQVHVVAVDPVTTAYRTVALPEADPDYLDRRLADGLDPDGHFTQQKRITFVPQAGTFTLDDVTTARFEAFDSLARVYVLYLTLSHDPKLVEFDFLLGWHKLDEAAKREKYSKHASHELSFFLSRKDPQFFEAVVQPHLRHKQDKTFLDRYLVGDELSEYRRPWQHARLNVVERILLARRIEEEREPTTRHVRDLYALVPPNVERFNALFATAVQTTALDFNGEFESRQKELRPGLRLPPGRDLSERFESQNGAALSSRSGAMGPPVASAPAPSDQQSRPPGSMPAGGAFGGGAFGRPGRDANANGVIGQNVLGESAAPEFGYFADDAPALYARRDIRQLYRQLDKTMEWVENNYYQLPIEQQNAELVQVNAFWRDFAAHDPGSAFRSVHFPEASRNFTEMMFALSVLDLPPESPAHQIEFADSKMTLKAAGPLIAVHEEIRPARLMDRSPPILVSENFFRHSNRYRYVDNERLDKFVDDEFLVHTVYGAQVVVTNPTSTPQKLDLLVQIPRGAIPVLGSRETRSLHLNLEPYRTQAVEYHFYFPAPGEYVQYPAHVARNEQVLAHARPATFKVVERLSRIDTEAWDYLSQHGTDEQVVDWLRQHNLHRVDLARIAFRMKDAAFFRRVTDLLAARHAYNHTLWSYAILHNAAPAIGEYLRHADAFVQQTGEALDSPLLVIDPVERKTYQHMEYRPLVNARTHQLGRRRQILNDRLLEQYQRLLKILSYRRALDDEDLMAVTYYLLVQDRVGEALAFFEQVNPDALDTRLQHDYFAAYTAFYTGDVDRARAIADRYADYPVDRWRNLFAAVRSQADEISGAAEPQIVDMEDRTQQQTQLAATEGSFDFTVEARQVVINYQKLDAVRVNYYPMDVELLFSSNPFVQRYAGRFSYIRPNASDTVELPADRTTHRFELPERFHNANVLVEIVAGGQKRTQAHFAHSLAVQVVENYGHVQVSHDATGRPVPKTYVKVYARLPDGRVRFYKDGYTDLRGRFDYTSLSTSELDHVERFALLVLSDEHGAIVREAAPPKR